nr:hypothetical protein [Cytophagales bacterium]
MITLTKLKPLLLVLSVPLLLIIAFALAAKGGWPQLWNFIFGYGVGAFYAWINWTTKTRNA